MHCCSLCHHIRRLPKIREPSEGSLYKDYSNYFGVHFGVPLFEETAISLSLPFL